MQIVHLLSHSSDKNQQVPAVVQMFRFVRAEVDQDQIGDGEEGGQQQDEGEAGQPGGWSEPSQESEDTSKVAARELYKEFVPANEIVIPL